MAWTTPKTDWETGELVAASDMNAIGENFAALQHPPTAVHTTAAEIVASASEFTDVDGGNLNLTITTRGGDVLVHFDGSVACGSRQSVYFDIEVDDLRQGASDGILRCRAIYDRSMTEAVSFTRLIQNLNAGSHTFKLQWKMSANITLHAGAQFWVREI